MSQGALHIALGPDGPRIAPPRPLGAEALVLGRTPEEAAELLPRIFNLCRAAQSLGARMALGLPVRPEDSAALAQEIAREHLMRFFVLWPRRLGLSPAALPRPDSLLSAVFGPAGRSPDPATLDDWLASGEGVAPVMAAIAAAFAPGDAVADLPAPSAETLSQPVAQENSPWTRHRNQPLLAAAEKRVGHGPFWRALARLIDLEACASDSLDLAPWQDNGTTYVPAARGTYALSARIADGRVAGFTRHTPTDHMLAAGGALEQSLASLPAAKAHLAPLVIDILDLCLAVEIAEAKDA